MSIIFNHRTGAIQSTGTAGLTIQDSGGTDDVTMSHDGTNLTATATNTTGFNFANFGGGIRVLDGAYIRIFDSTDTDYAEFSHDGTDFNTAFTTTTDWNITGITAIAAGTVDADFDAITATSYGGITEANLLDKTAAETVSGIYTFSAAPKFTAAAAAADDGGTITLENANPAISYEHTDAAADEKNTLLYSATDAFEIRLYNDAWSANTTPLQINRTGTTVDSVIVNATSFQAYGDGTAPDSHYMGVDTNDRFRFEGGTNYGLILYEDNNVSTETSSFYIGNDTVSTGRQSIYFRKGGSDWAQFDNFGSSSRFEFTGPLEIAGTTDHVGDTGLGTDVSSDRIQVWAKSRSLDHEPMITTGDSDLDYTFTNIIETSYHFDQTTTAADPGAGNLRWNNATPASVTNWYIDDVESTGRDASFMLANLADGDILTLRSQWDAADYMVASVNGTPTDNTGYWTVPVTVIHAGARPATGDPVHIHVEWAGSQAGGGGITGTVANDQVVVGTGASTVDSSSSFTFDGATLAVTASTAHNFYSGAASSIARFGRNANENFRFDVTDGNSTITLDQDETDATSHQFLLNIESANTGERGFEFQNNGSMVMEISFLNDQITTDGVDFAMTKLGSEGDTILKIEADSDNLVEASNPVLHLTQDGEQVHGTFELQDSGNLVALTSGTTFAGRTTVISWPYNSTAVSFAGDATVAGTLNANGGIAFNDVTDTIAGIQNQNLLDKTATETVSGAYTFSNSANVLSGNITSTVNSNTGIEVGYLGINSTSGSDGHGLSLYNGYVDGEPTYGIMFAQTATFGTHGDVSNDWATYFTMNTTANRGWIWREAGTANLASLSNEGTFTLGENNILQPWISVDSVNTGDNWTNQGAGISVGESGKKGSAAIHMTYNGDGSGYVGMGAVDNTAGTGGRPAFSHIDFTYNSDVIGLRSQVQVIGGSGTPYLRVYDAGDTDYLEIQHDGTDAILQGSNTLDLRLESTITGQLVLEGQAIDHWPTTEGADTIRAIKYPSGGYYKNDLSGQTGAFRITWPITAGQNSMVHVTIRGYDYSANTGPWEVHIGGYDNSSGAWNNQSVYSTGAPPFDVVYFETDDVTTNHYVRLGDYTDTHQYPQIWIEEVAVGFSNQGSAWDTGWDISLVTTGTGISTATTERLFRQYGVTNDVYMNFGAAQDVYFTGATIGYFFDDNVNVQAGNSLIVNGTGGDYISISHDGTDVTMANLGTRYIDMELTSVLEFRVQDSDGATGRTSGAQVKDHGQTMRDVGFNVLPTFNFNASDTLEAQHCGHVTGKTNTSLYTLTGPTSSDLDWPVGAVTTVMNLGTSGNYLISDTTTCTMYLMEGDGTAPADIVGTCTLGPGGVATLYRYSSTAIYIWGSGITL